MSNRLRLCLLLVGIGLGQAPGAQAQGERAYIEIAPPGNGMETASVMAQRLARIQGLSETQKLAQDILKNPTKYGLDQATIDRWKESQQQGARPATGAINEQMRRVMRRALQSRPEYNQDGQPTPERGRIAATLRREEEISSPPEPDTRPDPSTGGKLPPVQPRPSGGPAQETPAPPEPVNPAAEPPPSPPAEAVAPAPEADTEVAQWLLRQAEQLQNVKGPWHNSQTLSRAINSLSRYIAEGGAVRARAGQGGLTGHLGDLLRTARAHPVWSGSTWAGLRSLPMPSLPKPHLPGVSLPRISVPGMSTPSFGRPSAPSAESGLSVLWVLVLLVLGVILWKLVGRRMVSTEPVGRGWRLGPWPVDPRAVATREDLVRAFDYLSLLKLGPAARHWNHLDIAAGLGGEEMERRIAADHLATLYEQARYAPGNEPLPAEAFLAARRELSFLAGVAPA
ncbi:MAG TPA: hypothetical protein VG013_26735 [Gemmataceae bacterium]|jgi:hypothetical protein|nr:hypothetical protein [Gemmataceae bacterium]